MAGQAARTAVLRLVKRALLFGPIAGLLMAPTCDQSFSGSSLVIGGNFRLDAIQAAVLAAKLPHLERWTAARRAHAASYRAAFASAGLAEVRLPVDDPAHVYHHFVIRAPSRDRLRDHLAAAGIGTEIYYPQPLHRAPALEALSYRAGSCPRAEAACAKVLALPIHPALSRDAPARVVDAIRGFYRR